MGNFLAGMVDRYLPLKDIRPGFEESTNIQIRNDNENTVNEIISTELDVPPEHNLYNKIISNFNETVANMNVTQ